MRKTRSARCGERVVRWKSLSRAPRQVTVSDRKMDESPECTQAQTIECHQLEIEPRGPFRLDLTAWALRRRSHNAVCGDSSRRAFPTVFEALANGVACQQLSLAVGICSTAWPPIAEKQCLTLPTPRTRAPTPEDLASLQPDDLKRHGFSSTARGWRGDRAPDQPAWRRPLDGRVCAPPRDGAPACLSWTRRRRAKQAQAVVRDRDTAGLRGGRPDGGALGIPKQALSTSICCSTPCPALRVRSPGEAGRW
jgi:hypothetical protein